MSSFLDSTGLSRLASKITDYFAKKDGTYPDMTVGNVSNVVPIEKLPTASSVTSGDTTHVPTADAVYDAIAELGGEQPDMTKYTSFEATFSGDGDSGHQVDSWYQFGMVTMKISNIGQFCSARVRGTLIDANGNWVQGRLDVTRFTMVMNFTANTYTLYLDRLPSTGNCPFRLHKTSSSDNIYVGLWYRRQSNYDLVKISASFAGNDGPRCDFETSKQLQNGFYAQPPTTPVFDNVTASLNGVGSYYRPVYVKPDGSLAECSLTKRPAVTGGSHLDWLFQNTTVITFGTSVNLDSMLVPDTTIDDVVHFLIVGNTASSAITITANNVGTSIPAGKYGMFAYTLDHVWKAVPMSSFV